MAYKVLLTNRAKKNLNNIDQKQRKIILSWINNNLQNSENPRSIIGSKHISGTDYGWRYRVGDYRILASIKDNELIIEIVRIGHRQSVYKNLPKF